MRIPTYELTETRLSALLDQAIHEAFCLHLRDGWTEIDALAEAVADTLASLDLEQDPHTPEVYDQHL